MRAEEPGNWSRDELVARFERGVWVFLIFIAVGTLSLIAFLAYELL